MFSLVGSDLLRTAKTVCFMRPQVLSTIDRFHPSHKRFQTRSKTADTHLRRKSLLAVNNTTLETADIASEARKIPDNVGVSRKEEIDLSDTRIEDTYPFR